jgi:hypothetical protein
MSKLRWALPIATLGLLVCAAPGFGAATRYASPDGAVTSSSACTVISGAGACTLKNAVEGAAEGDDVSLAAGAYSNQNNINVNSESVTIHGAPGNVTLITGTGVTPTIQARNGTVLRDLQLDVSTTGDPSIRADGTVGVVLERVSVKNTADYQALNLGTDSVVRDSFIETVATTAAPSAIFRAGGVIYNSTVVAKTSFVGGSPIALSTACQVPATIPLDIRNSIFIAVPTGTGIDINNSGAGCSLPTTASNSYFIAVTDPSGSLTQSAMVTTPPTLDSFFREMAGSSTIDKGTTSSVFAGEQTVFGTARCLGSAPDVGADEFAGSPCPVPPPPSNGAPDTTKPTISGLKAKKKKGKLETFDFTSSEAGTATFTFTKKKGKKYKSAGSRTKTVKAGNNTIKPKKLKKGKYKLTLTVKDAAGNVSSSKKLNFSTK